MFYCDVERDCLQVDGDEPAGDWAASHDSVRNVFVNKKSNAMLMFILFSIEENLLSFLSFLPKFFHLISRNPRMFHLYLSILCIASRSFPAALSVDVLHVPMVCCLFHESSSELHQCCKSCHHCSCHQSVKKEELCVTVSELAKKSHLVKEVLRGSVC